MLHREIHGTAHKAAAVRMLIAGALVACSAAAFCQSAPAPGSGSAAAADAAPSEAARRAALSPYRFILLNAQPVKPKPEPRPEKVAAPEPVRRPAPVETAAVSRPAASPPQSPALPQAKAAAPAPEPVSAPVALAVPKPPEPAPIVAVRRELVAVSTEPPKLPAELLRQVPTGTVRVQFEVNPDGSVGDVKVVHSTNRDLNKASVAAVKAWKFEALDEAQAVETELVYDYR